MLFATYYQALLYYISVHDKWYRNYLSEEIIVFYRHNEILELCNLSG